MRNQILVVALVRIEGVNRRPAEDRQLIEKLQRYNCQNIRHEELPKSRARQRILQNLDTKYCEHDKKGNQIGIHYEIENYSHNHKRIASTEKAGLQESEDSILL